MPITKCLIDDQCRKEYIFPTLLNWVEKGDVLPQKYLYSNHIGAYRYSELIKCGVHQKVYNSFPINVSGGELNQFFRDNIERLIGARLRGEKKLGFFILGAGVGNRESEMVRWLIYNFPEIESIRIWLLDISEEMMAKSIETFKRIGDERLDIRGFVLDFEESLSEIAMVREEIGLDIPCLFLLFGNTIANLDQEVFLNTIAQYMSAGDLLVMEYLLADEKTYRESFEGQQVSENKFGTVVSDYEPLKDNRFEFVVSPLRILGLSVHPESLKLYRKCILGKGISFLYVYALSEDEIRILEGVGLSKSLYSGWELPLLKIERLLSSYISRISQSSFIEPSMFKMNYDSGKDLTFIYSMMQKDWKRSGSLVAQNSFDSKGIIDSIRFDDAAHRVTVNQSSMNFTPKQFYLLLAAAHFPIERVGEDPGPEKIYLKFHELLVAWSERTSGIDYRTETVLENVEKLLDSEHAVFVSKGFRDIENKVKRADQIVFESLLPALPHRNQWYLNVSEACIEML